MNVVFLSPHFPPNYYRFCAALKESGANVLGLADAEYDALSWELRSGLTEYYRVSNLHDYDQLVRAAGYFTHRYGKIDRIESHNEYWLQTDAALRTDFNVFGIKSGDIDKIKRKSRMKEVFLQAGLKPARGKVCASEAELREFVAAVGYPVVSKPDIGVGAYRTYKICNEDELRRYLADKPPVEYITEEFIGAQIVSFDGLVDANGEVVFSSSLRYNQGVMEAVNDDSDLNYYFVREIEPAVEKAGRAALKAFGVRERFFHFEFFMKDDGEVIPLEVNMRPPGGLSLDMFNYCFDFDCYRLWSDLIVQGSCAAVGERRYFVIYIGRKDHHSYELGHHQVLERYAPLLVHHERISDVFAAAIGSYGYVLRHTELAPLLDAAGAIQRRNQAN